jgi:hypothetical protein
VIPGCRNLQVSIPIMAQDGRELAGRDENSRSTKIYGLGDDGTCTQKTDLEVQSGKVAWSPDGSRIAFAIPRGSNGPRIENDARPDVGANGIFVYDRAQTRIMRVPGSEDANRITFPEFVGPDSVMFLITGETVRDPSLFRLFCCVR